MYSGGCRGERVEEVRRRRIAAVEQRRAAAAGAQPDGGPDVASAVPHRHREGVPRELPAVSAGCVCLWPRCWRVMATECRAVTIIASAVKCAVNEYHNLLVMERCFAIS